MVKTTFNMILYGDSGAGKSPFCATLADCPLTSPCLFLDVDMGTLSVTPSERMTIVEMYEWGQIGEVYAHLKARTFAPLAVYLSKLINEEVPPLQYKSVVIDSGTELEYVCRKMVLAQGKGEEVPEQADYLRTQERMRKLFRYFRDLPDMSVVMTAGVRELKDDVSGVVKHSPAFQPTLAKDLVRMTDEVIFMGVIVGDKEKTERALRTTLSTRFAARDRSQRLDALIKGEKLYFRDIVPKILGVTNG